MTVVNSAMPRARSVLRLRRAGKYVAIFRTGLMTQLAYPADLWLRTIFVVVIMFIFSSLWRTTYGETGSATLGGLSFTQMLWYLAITESVLLSRPRDSVQIDVDVRSGTLAYQLARPYNYVLYRFAQISGERLPRFGATVVVAGATAALFSGGLALTPAGLTLGLPVLLLALSLDFLMVLTVSLLALWLEDTTPFIFIYDRFLMILGGMLLPLELFPDALERILRLLPFAAVVYAPARLFVDPSLSDAVRLVGIQSVWLAVFAVAGSLLFAAVSRRLQSNGG